jgi:hypothetical protein
MGCSFSEIERKDSNVTTFSEEHKDSIYVLPFESLKDFSELGRLGIGRQQRQQLGLGPNQRILDEEVKKTISSQDISSLFIQIDSIFIPAEEVLVDLKTVNRSSSIVIYVSHTWMSASESSPGYRGRPHPDDAQNHKFYLLWEGIEKLHQTQFPDIDKVYVWLDFTCINQDGNPGVSLKHLDVIMRSSDVMFTPIYDDQDEHWSLTSDDDEDLFKDYQMLQQSAVLQKIDFTLFELMFNQC